MMENIYIQMFTRCLRFLPPDELGSPTRIQLCVVLAAVTVRGGPSPPGQCPGHACGVLNFLKLLKLNSWYRMAYIIKYQMLLKLRTKKPRAEIISMR